jgi:formamidopyrimidine-DNA glycosylase
MIELPESLVLASQVRSTLIGKTITNVLVNASPHKFAFFSLDARRYPSLLIGKTLTDANSYGGQLEIVFEDVKLFFSDGACPHYVPAGETLPVKHQLMLQFSDDGALYVSIAMYGMMYLLTDENQRSPYIDVAMKKPSPLSEGFDLDYFKSIIATCPDHLSVKAMLATEQRIPGLGNGCLQDILFFAKIHPKRKKATIGDEQITDLYASIRSTLRKMAQQGGRANEKDLFGNNGGYTPILYAKTVGTACPACSSIIVKEPYLGGSITFCPHCQK